MILQDNDTTIEQIGTITDEAQFKMKASRKAFQILSDLYSDKPLAIVRELGCNASDSMTASGQSNRSFHIHLPNTLEPWLTIQDFGTGISHENIYNVYTTYFESTKTNTNTQIGCLGLGSKSPFCYTDNFTITSIVNGDKRIYNAYFNASNMPTISLMSMEKTTDENGIAIQIPIKSNDFSLFSHAVYKAFRFFDVRPTISGGTIDWEEIKPEFTGSFWKSYSKMNQSYAIMGGVTYPIDTYKIDSEHYDIIRKAGLVIKFNIGEIDFTPSRESLSYCESTIKALNDKIDLVKKDFVAKVEETIKDSPNLLDALKALYLLKNQWSFLNSTLINGKVLWNKVDITDPRKSIRAIYQDTFQCFSKTSWGRSKWSISGYAALDNNALWYFDDLKRGSQKRVTTFVRGHINKDISINLVDQKSMNDLIDSGFPASVFIPTSTLPPVTIGSKKGSVKNSKPKGIISLYNCCINSLYNCGTNHRLAWDSENFDLSTGTAPKYYVVKDVSSWNFGKMELTTTDGKKLMTIQDKSTLIDFCKYAGISIDDVRMVSKNNAKFLDTLGSTNLADVVNKKQSKLSWDKIQQAKHIEFKTAQSISRNSLYSKISDTNPFKIFVDSILDLKKEIGKMESILEHISTEDRKKDLTYPSKIVELFYLSCDSWQVGVEITLQAVLETEQTN